MNFFQRRSLLIFIIICQLLLIISLNNTVFADENSGSQSGNLIEVKYESVNPSPSYGYSFKRLKEKITLIILSPFPSKKSDYYMDLMKVRLAEFKYVVDKKDISNLQTTSERYFTTAGELTDLILKNKLEAKKGNAVMLFEDHVKVAAELEKSYSDDTAQWRLIRYTSDNLQTYLSELKK